MNAIRAIKKNLGVFVAFQLLFAVVGVLISAFSYNVLLRAAVDVSVGYLATHTLSGFLLNPLSWLVAIVHVLLSAGLGIFGISGFVFLNECSRQGLRVRLRHVVRFSVSACVRICRLRNIKIVLLIVFIIPLFNLGIAPLLGSFIIPDFIMEYIGYYWYLTVAFAAAALALLVVLLRWRFVFNVMMLEGLDFKQAAARSAQLGRGHHITDALGLLLCEIIAAICAFAILLVTIMVALLLGVAASNFAESLPGTLLGITSGCFAVLGVFVAVCALLLSVPLGYSYLSNLYYKRVIEREGCLRPLDLSAYKHTGRNPFATALVCVAAVAMAVVCSVAVVEVVDGGVSKYFSAQDVRDVFGSEQTAVVAHRCGAHFAPENTVAALNKAADMGAEWCELDAQQLADGTIVILHDSNFKRTTGYDKDTWEATWEEVEKLDAGSSYSEEFAGEKIPTLEQIIKAAQARGMKLQIEVKPTGHETNLEQAVVEQVLANNFQDQCVIASMNYESLRKVRDCSPKVRTLYITTVAFGDVMKASAADDFSIEATFITRELVDYLHGGGRSVSAWTTNSEEIMERCISCGVDLLVTDEVEIAREYCLLESPASIAERLVSFLDLSQ